MKKLKTRDLKTLKDIFEKVVGKGEVELINNSRCGEVDWFAEGILENYNGMLRQELIKWIKKLEQDGKYSAVYNMLGAETAHIIFFIKHFANITDEERPRMKLPPLGSAGWCASCKHKNNCKMSTVGTPNTRQGECKGVTTIILFSGKKKIIRHKKYVEDLK